VLLEPLPFDDQEALVSVAHTARGASLDDVGLSTAMALTYRDEHRFFEDIGFWTGEQVAVTGRGNPERVTAMRVTAAILPILRIQPVVGRRFTREDDIAGAPHTVMLGHAYWQSRFASDPSVRGSTLRVDGIPREIIGVLPPWFRLSPQQEVSIYLPFQLDRGDLNFAWAYRSVARLRPGATIEQAGADVARMLRMVPERIPETATRFNLGIPVAEIANDAEVLLAYEDMWRRFREIPGVSSVGASTSVTMGGDFGYGTLLLVEDVPQQLNDPLTTKRFNWVTGDYFATMQNPVLAGRAIDWADIRGRRAVAMLTANLAEEYWENPRDAIGKRVRMPIRAACLRGSRSSVWWEMSATAA
jgi:hypothetical protein